MMKPDNFVQESKVHAVATPIAFPLIAGACAGAVVDFTLFPIDTIKTRLQSEHGFWLSGGFRRIYAGLLPALVGSAPNAAIFFLTYETTKSVFQSSRFNSSYSSLTPAVAATCGEVSACVVRVPAEVLKQRSQAFPNTSTGKLLRHILTTHGVKGLYRGYFSTVLREIPFSCIQFTLWELLKRYAAATEPGDLARHVSPIQSSLCGMLAGGTAAFVTTPLDVAKTRIMLAQHTSSYASGNVPRALMQLYKEGGVKRLFSGAIPRTLWISAGGFLFLGGYDFCMHKLREHYD